MDKMTMAATEALFGMQTDCDAMRNLTETERNGLLKSVSERMREIHNEALEEATQFIEEHDIGGTFFLSDVCVWIRSLKEASALAVDVNTSGKGQV